MKIYDLFMPRCLEDQISDILLDPNFSWKCTVNPTSGGSDLTKMNAEEKEKAFQDTSYLAFASPLFDYQNVPFTTYALLMQGAIYCMCDVAGVRPNSIMRIRAGMYLPTLNKPDYNDPHIDADIPHTVILYYVNDCDGDTYFFDKNNNVVDTVSPKKGRMVVFDGNTTHASSQPSKGVRVTLNLNFHGLQI